MANKKAKKKFVQQASVNIGLIGHTDAGKTSLVEAITGKWTDTHSEELKKGISIRIGYADATFHKCQKCKLYFAMSDKCPKCGNKGVFVRKVSFVDAPGHETLMITMLSGAALMHGAILVIAANESCPQPQTVEHLNAIKIVGIDKLVVVQNKIDLVSKKEALENYAQIQAFLKEHNVKAPVVPVAAPFKSNIHYLIEAIEKTIPTPKFNLKKPFRMHCGRSFDVNKPGSSIEKLVGGVLGGTVIQGTAKIGDKIEISPGPKEEKIVTKICSLSCSDGPLDKIVPGGLVAIGTELDPSITQNDQMKGQVIGAPNSLPAPVRELTLDVTFIERVTSNVGREVKTNQQLVLVVGTMPVIGTVLSHNGNTLKLMLNRSVVVEKGQRIPISTRHEMKWRLIAYGTVK